MLPAKMDEYSEYVSDALQVVEFKLVRNKDDFEDESRTFRPLMAHQIFGDTENIFGYKGLKVRLLYTAGPMHIYLGIEYDQKVSDESSDLNPDDVVATIADALPNGCYFVNLDDFCKTLEKTVTFRPFGEKLSEYRRSPEFAKLTNGCGDSPVERHFEFYHCNFKDTAFFNYFSRLQTFVLWFIDAASYIDLDDPQWSYFVCYEKYKTENGEEAYATVGYTTVYEYYGYPEHKRPRISQMLILPPFQKLGIGTRMLETIYDHYRSQINIIDITVEDPALEFQRMRNFVDARLCLKLSLFKPDAVKKGFTKEMIDETRKSLKLNPRQCRKVYEIVRLLYTNIHDDKDYTAYRIEVKRRLNAVYFKQMRDIQKLENAKADTKWVRSGLPSTEERLKQLHEEYKLVETDYMSIVEKLRDVKE